MTTHAYARRRRIGVALVTMTCALLLSAAVAVKHDVASAPNVVQPSDSAAAAASVARYHQALAEGDSLAALALLASDAVILETGNVETRDHYRSGHLASDIAFARAVPAKRSPIKVTVQGNVAWASSTSTTQGEFRGRAVNSAGAELMVLTREADGWKIRAIHWSSRAVR